MKKFLIGFLLLLSIAIVSFSNLTGNNKIKAGIGDTIADTFPDINAAQAIANIIASGDTNAIITQNMIDTTYSLSLNNQNIYSIEGITIFQNLSYLNLASNHITTLPDNFGSLTNLQNLYISTNQLISLPDSFGSLTNLKELSLYGNQLTILPDSFSNLSKVETLSLLNNQLTRLPYNFGNLSNLKYLWLQNNQLTSLPTSFASLSSFTLHVSNNLLPTGFESSLPNINIPGIPGRMTFDQLELQNGLAPIDITGQTDLDNLDLASMVALESQRTLSLSHEYILEGYVDENNDPVDLNDYISPSGAVIKEGKVFASIRATGEGLFPNNSDHAVTVDKIELNFILTLYEATFDLNGGEGTAPDSQQVMEGELLIEVADPLRSGYTFIGWNTAIDGSGTTWDFATDTMPAGDITLYAIWADNSTGTEDNSIDKLPQTGLIIYLIAGVTTLVAGITLIIINKRKIKR